MADEKLISRTISIAGVQYPVKLTSEEIEIAEKVEQVLNDKIMEYRMKYTVNNTRDILAMLLISYAFEIESTPTDSRLKEAGEKIERLMKLVSQHGSTE